MFNSPTIVIGPPRSGTTMTAKVLQEWFGILMDGAPMRPDKVINPYGWMEDTRLVQANSLFLEGRMGRTPKIRLGAWTRRFKRYILQMEKRDRPWGFKDPRIIPLFSYALTFFKSPTVIRCHRPKEMVVKSYVEKLKWDKEIASKRYDSDEKSLDMQLKTRLHYRIDFKEYVSEEQILDFFQNTEIIRHAA
jgi:hypothetical protein